MALVLECYTLTRKCFNFDNNFVEFGSNSKADRMKNQMQVNKQTNTSIRKLVMAWQLININLVFHSLSFVMITTTAQI